MILRAHVIKAVFQRNFSSYFSGPLGYVFIVFFVAISSLFAFSSEFFAAGLANLNKLNDVMPFLLLFFVPAISMSAWADERKQGTDELLFTLPASDFEIVLGKYLSVLGVYTVALAFSLSHLVVLAFLGGFDTGLMFTTYVGYWFMGAALLSTGMVASILTSSATVAYILGAVLCFAPVTIDLLAPSSRLLQGLSIREQFRDFGMGLLPLSGVLYFCSLSAFMLYVNMVLASRRHWMGGPHGKSMGTHLVTRTIALGIALIGVNSSVARGTSRLDLTSSRLYSLSSATTKVIAEVPEDRPILIQAYVSPQVPGDLSQARSTLIGLLRQFDQLGGDRIRVRIVSTEKYTTAADEAKRYGIEPRDIQTMVGGKYAREDVYMGVVVTGSVDDVVTIPFFDKGTPIEYELTRSIRTVAGGKRKKVGVLRTDAQLTGGFDMQAFRQLPEWQIVQDLKKQYEVVVVGPDELTTKEDLDVLFAVMPSSLTDTELEGLVKYVESGKPTLIVDDPFPRFNPPLAPKNPKPRPGGNNPFGGGGPPPQPKCDIGRLTRALQISWDSGEAVWDRFVGHPGLKDMFDAWNLHSVVTISPENQSAAPFSRNSKITKDLNEIMLFYPGTLKKTEGMKNDFEPLLRASPNCRTYKWDEYFRGGFMGMMEILNPPDKDPADDIKAPVIAAHIRREATKSDVGVNTVFVADMDMIANEFFFIRDKEWQDLKLDNIAFVLNAIDVLASDEDFVQLRGRSPKHRTLLTVESRVKTFREKEAKASEEAEKAATAALDAVTASLQKAIDAIESREDLDPRQKAIQKRIAEENKIRELEVKKAGIENDKQKKIKALKDATQREVNRITDVFRAMALMLPPIPPLVLAMFIYVMRLANERQGMNPDRLARVRR